MRLQSRTVGSLAAVVILGSALAIPAIAQDAPADGAESEPTGRPDRGARLAEALADELDLPVEDVEAALDAVRERFEDERRATMREHLAERLDAAVEAGDLTRDQAEAILEAFDSGVLPGRHGPGPGMRGGPGHLDGPGGGFGGRGGPGFGPGFRPHFDAPADRTDAA